MGFFQTLLNNFQQATSNTGSAYTKGKAQQRFNPQTGIAGMQAAQAMGTNRARTVARPPVQFEDGSVQQPLTQYEDGIIGLRRPTMPQAPFGWMQPRLADQYRELPYR